MEILKVTKITQERDWRFYDIEAEVYEVPNPDEFDCSFCAIKHSTRPPRQIRIAIPFQQIKLIKQVNDSYAGHSHPEIVVDVE